MATCYNDVQERKAVKKIYKLLILNIIIFQFVDDYLNYSTLFRIIQISCLFLSILYSYRLYRKGSLLGYDKSVRTISCVFLFVSLEIILRGDFKSSLNENGLLIVKVASVYLLPFIILPLPNSKYCSDILHLFYKASLFVFPIWIIYNADLIQTGPKAYMSEGIGQLLPFFSAFLLGYIKYFKKKERMIIFTVYIIYLILMLLNARRNVSFSLLLYASIAYVFYLRHSLKKNVMKSAVIVLGTLLLFQALLLNFDSLAKGTFNNMASRLNEDTRSGVEEFFFHDFMNSSSLDWIFGRGMSGTYAQTVIDRDTGEINDRRTSIETGYLNMIMKGGIVYVVIVLVLLIKSVKAAFKYGNDDYKYLGTILLTYLIDLYTTNPVCDFSVRSIIFWFAVSCCLQNKNINIRKQLIRSNDI